ncbi:MAG TPA: hypothetical protein VHK91_08295 [Flavisolibacter sp.]|jgi:hypothetical protein|nr:hypothetical protein [Flavisolibacter sp.]
MKSLFFSSCFLLSSYIVIAQKTYKVEAGEAFADIIPKNEIVKYSSFTDGVVTMKNGKKATAKLNYHYLFGEIEFINQKDTLSLDNENAIENVAIGTDSFIYNNGYLQLIRKGKDHSLVKKEGLILTDKLKENGGFGKMNASYGQALRSISSRNALKQLIANETLVFTQVKEFLLIDSKSDLWTANKKNFLKLYPGKKKELENFIDTNNITFNKEEDLLRVFQYAETL